MNSAAAGVWREVEREAARLSGRRIIELFADPGRLEFLTLNAGALHFDFSKQRIDRPAMAALMRFALATGLVEWRDKLFAGETVNPTEHRAAMHWELRAPAEEGPVAEMRARLAAFAEECRSAPLPGWNGRPVEAVVHIGIGGSDLGPRLVYDALKAQSRPGFELRFASNIDPADIADALHGLDPATTLVMVVSKTFTTLETMTNAEAARHWLRAALGQEAANAHLAAVSAAPERAKEWGVAEERVFPFWDTIGGRYSLWSAVSLSVDIAMQPGAFEAMLAGAAQMDRHFREAPLPRNAPIIGALVQTWNRTALNRGSYAICPYAQRLKLLPSWLQQLEMESNGKGVDREGRKLAHSAAAVTWGDVGTVAQHSFFQLLHQGVDEIPLEFLFASDGGASKARMELHANAVAQAEALLVGKTEEQAFAELRTQGATEAEARALAPHKTFPGDRPSTLIGLARLSPETLGALLAYYEHRTFVQGVLVGVNSFDQWGVELGKAMAKSVAQEISGEKPPAAHDPSTAAWIERLKRDQIS